MSPNTNLINRMLDDDENIRNILVAQLITQDFPRTTRFPILSASSRHLILNARQVERQAREILEGRFIELLEETPFA